MNEKSEELFTLIMCSIFPVLASQSAQSDVAIFIPLVL